MGMESKTPVTGKSHTRRASAAIVQPTPSSLPFPHPLPLLSPNTSPQPHHAAHATTPPPEELTSRKPTNPAASQSRALNRNCHALACPHPPIPSAVRERSSIDSALQPCHSTSHLVSRRRLQEAAWADPCKCQAPWACTARHFGSHVHRSG